MKDCIFYPIPDICWCGKCNEIVWNGNRYINGHNNLGCKFSKEHCKNMSKSMLGLKKIFKNGSPSKNPKTAKKISEHHMGKNNPFYGKHHTKEHNIIISNKLRGDKGPNWCGGLSFRKYSYDFNETLKQEIRKQDNYQCQNLNCLCNQLESKILYNAKLSVHHIDYNKDNCSEENLITLCLICNLKANFNRDYWEEHFMKILKERNLI